MIISVLVLDDNVEVTDLLRVSLSRHFAVSTFNRGIDALISILERIKAGDPYHFLLLDCAMPHLDAFTITQIVRLIEGTELCPRHTIGVFTAHPDIVENTSLVERVQVDHYWRKPEDVVQLTELIMSAVKQAENPTHSSSPS